MIKNVEAVQVWGICKHYICAWWIVANSGIFGDIGEFINAIHAREKMRKMRENARKCEQKESLQKFAQKKNRTESDTKKSGADVGKVEKSRTKKEFCNTITRRSGKPLFSGQC